MLNANKKKYSSLVFYVCFLFMHFTPQLLRHYSRGHVCLFVCLRPTHRLFMGRTLTATRTDAMTHPWGPGPESHTLSQFSVTLGDLTQLWAAPEDVSVSAENSVSYVSVFVRGAGGARLVFTQQSSCKRWIYPGRSWVVRVIVPEWFTASALCWQQRGIQNAQQTRHCRLQAWNHHALSGLPGFRIKTAQLLLWGVKYTFFWHGSTG